MRECSVRDCAVGLRVVLAVSVVALVVGGGRCALVGAVTGGVADIVGHVRRSVV